jgi:hypothetical protein
VISTMTAMTTVALLCGYAQATPQPRECRRLCKATADCQAGTVCAPLGTADFSFGLCAPTCEPFMNTCAPGVGCHGMTLVDEMGATAGFGCNLEGTKAPFEACKSNLECGNDAGCLPGPDGVTFECTPFCDGTHPCADPGATCSMFTTPVGYGKCIK